MKTSLKLAVGTVVVWSLAQAYAGDGEIKLRYKPVPGELIYQSTTKTSQTQNLMNKEIKNDFWQRSISVWSIGQPDKDGNLTIRTQGKILEAKMKLGDQEDYTFDSRKNDNETGSTLGKALTPLYERLSTGNISFTITPVGTITKVEGFNELIGDLVKENAITAQFAGGGSDDVMKIGLSEIIPGFSEKAISPGSRWETPYEKTLDKLGTFKGKKTYVYEGAGDVGGVKTIKLSTTSELAFDLDLDMGDVKITGKMSITESKGTIHFDPQRSVVVSLSSEYKLAGNLNVSAGGMNIPVTQDQTQNVTMELLDKLPK